MAQHKASQHTISSYAHTFRLLIKFAQKRLGISPSKLTLAELNAPFLVEFLADLEASRGNDARSRNARLAALRSFYQYAALESP
jgi:site-specific recombinase XerD